MISILLPTRNRPEQLKRLYSSFLNTVSDPTNIEFVFYVDKDDNVSYPVINKIKERFPVQIISKGLHVSASCMINMLATASKGDILLNLGDDNIFITHGWDLIVQNTFLENPSALLVYGVDKIQNIKIATWGFIRRKLIDILGFFLPEGYFHSYTDTWITEVTRKAGVSIYCPDLIIEHLHYTTGKTKLDETYEFSNKYFNIDNHFYNSPSEVRNRELAIEKIKSSLT